jgi:hypothetical protein
VSCPTEALFSQLESFCLPVFSGFSPLFAETATKFSEVSRVTNFGNKPGLWSECTDRLLLHDPADWRWPEGNRVTSLGHRQLVLSSVLAEEHCSAQTASRRGCRFVLESCSSIARRIDSESIRRLVSSTKPWPTSDSQWTLRMPGGLLCGGAAPQLRDAPAM